MKTHVETGNLGEQKATAYLISQGYKILEKNHREKWGELDIVAKSPDRTLVFVEVKTLVERGRLDFRPEDHMTKDKINRVKSLALFYANKNTKLVDQLKGWRVDLIALTISNNCYEIHHYKNI